MSSGAIVVAEPGETCTGDRETRPGWSTGCGAPAVIVLLVSDERCPRCERCAREHVQQIVRALDDLHFRAHGEYPIVVG